MRLVNCAPQRLARSPVFLTLSVTAASGCTRAEQPQSKTGNDGAATTNETGSGEGFLNVRLQDEVPDGIESINVTLSEVTAKPKDGPWVTDHTGPPLAEPFGTGPLGLDSAAHQRQFDYTYARVSDRNTICKKGKHICSASVQPRDRFGLERTQ